MTASSSNFKQVWRRLSVLDLIALAVAAAGLSAVFLGLRGGLYGFVKFLALCAGAYLIYRLIGWGRNKLLWSLRNRLIVAYLFIAVVPIVLILIGAAYGAQVLYRQLGAYLLYEDIQRRTEMIRDLAEHIAAAHSVPTPGVSEEKLEEVLEEQSHAVHDTDLPGLDIKFSPDMELLRKLSGPAMQGFAGLVQQGDTLSLTSIREVPHRPGARVVILQVPITEKFLASVAPDLGAIRVSLMRRYSATGRGVAYTVGNNQYERFKDIVARNRALQPPAFWLDTPVDVLSNLNCAYIDGAGRVEPVWPVFATSEARPSQLNARTFSSLGELRDTYQLLFTIFGVLFFLIEVGALIIGIILTSRITTAVGDLYHATQFVQAGDFSHRVRVEHGDQLGVLGDSFNQMTESIGSLIEEQKRANRLQGELSIAREVQNQLFPQSVPEVPGVEIEAICKAARMVSGDYYDFIQLSPTHIAIAVADISGKGISAALLMASLQAALRSQMLAPGSEHLSTADLVARLNLHLTRNTADDRFATFFIAVYDSATRTLRYTNAGHLPSFLIGGGKSERLTKGGMVLGVVEDYEYEEGTVAVAPGALLVGYSDGLVEPENVYGEEFGIRRLEDAALRVHSSNPAMVAESLMAAAEEWAGTPEQADDMTVIVARLQ